MHGKNKPDSGTLYDQVSNTPGRSRVENRVAWELPDWRAPFPTKWQKQDSRKDERPDTILMDYELDPGCLPVQNHMENLRVFEDSWFFNWIILRHGFSGMHGKNIPDSGTLCDQVWNTPGRSRVENRVAWEEPGWRAPLATK